jgi:hypothetical protein
VANLTRQFSHARGDVSNDIVAVDIESTFFPVDEQSSKAQDKIDILLFNKKTGCLYFVEAKEYTNKELWSETK